MFAKSLLAATGVAAMTVGSRAVGAEAMATASATIVTPIAIANAANLSFGNIEASTTGTVSVSTAGVRTANGVKLSGGSPRAAVFAVTGHPGLSYNVTYTGTSPTLSHGTDALGFAIVSDMGGAAASSGSTVESGVFGTGTTMLRVGGILTVSSAGTPPGTYTGTIAVSVQYQ